MFEEVEVMAALISSVILIFILFNFRYFKTFIPHFFVLFLAYLTLFLRLVATNIEVLCQPYFFNFLEHIAMTINLLLFGVWIYLFLYRERKQL